MPKTVRRSPLLAGVLVLLVTAVAVGVTACGGDDSADLPAGVVARVGDANITQQQLDRSIAQTSAEAKSQGQTVPTQGADGYDQLQQLALQQLVRQKIVAFEARDCGQPCKVTDAEIDRDLKRIIQQNFNGKQAEFDSFLTDRSISQTEARELVQSGLQQQKLYNHITRGVRFTDQDAKAYYDAHTDQFQVPAGRVASHILVPTEAEADQIRAELTPENFAEIAREKFDRHRLGQAGRQPRPDPEGPARPRVREGRLLAQGRRDLPAGEDPVRLAHHHGRHHAGEDDLVRRREGPDRPDPALAEAPGRVHEVVHRRAEGLGRAHGLRERRPEADHGRADPAGGGRHHRSVARLGRMIRVIALGPGAPEAVPAAALAALAGAPRVLAPPLDPALAAALPGAPEPLDLSALPADAAVAAPDAEAHRIARALPDAETVPGRDALRARAIGAEVAALAEVGLRLRRECPWDRVQTAETIVPHTIEEAFEVADAVARGGDGLPDELGDLLFQAVFLAQLLEEEGGADLGAVARGQADKLIRRHPHVYGDAAAETPSGVVDLWERRKRAERAEQGIFHDLPAGLPALAWATKAQRRAAAAGFDHPDAASALHKLDEETAELRDDPGARELGDVLFAAVAVARALGADPELALRASAQRFRARVEEAARLAAASGADFEALPLPDQLRWYEAAKA